MTERGRRRVRIRRKRRRGRELDGDVDVDGALDSSDAFGCCLFEVVVAGASLFALLALPVGLLLW